MENFEEINRAQGAKKAEKLKELRELRNQEKAIKARIDEISDEATQEAVAIAPDGGEFEVDGQKYQLQRTEVFDMMNYNRYKDEDAKRWRSLAGQRDFAKKTASAYTKEMGAIVKSFVTTHPDWEPDEIKLTVKIIE